MRLTERIREGLHALAGIGETIIEVNGEGWGLECLKGDDWTRCDRPECEECQEYENVIRACAYVRQLANKPKRKGKVR